MQRQTGHGAHPKAVPPPRRSPCPRCAHCSYRGWLPPRLPEGGSHPHSRDRPRPQEEPSPSPVRKTRATSRPYLKVLGDAFRGHRLGDHDQIPLHGEPDQNLRTDVPSVCVHSPGTVIISLILCIHTRKGTSQTFEL